MNLFTQQFDKLLLFVIFAITIGVYLKDSQEFTQGLVSTVLGAIILALTGRALGRSTDTNGKPKE